MFTAVQEDATTLGRPLPCYNFNVILKCSVFTEGQQSYGIKHEQWVLDLKTADLLGKDSGERLTFNPSA